MQDKKLEKLLDNLPRAPGVYIMKAARGKVLYVGKAKNLSSRVRAYFGRRNADSRYFARNVRRYVEEIEICITNSEKEALLLEEDLIKLHSPRFNIRLKDDKSYLSLRLDRRAPWPRLEVVRRSREDGADYFGPYHSASAARETLRLVQRHFKLRSCKDSFMKSRTRPCLQHQMHRCLAPCVLDVDRGEYLGRVEFTRLFLGGRLGELEHELAARMNEAAAALDYEHAAALRDQLGAVRSTLEPQRVRTRSSVDRDVVGLSRSDADLAIAVLEIRAGRLTGKREFRFFDQESPDDDVLSSFVMQRYGSSGVTPAEIILTRPVTDTKALAEVLSERSARNVRVAVARRGAMAELAAMADRNAEQSLATLLNEEGALEKRLAAVQRRLGLKVLPRRIECVDISHLGGTDTVAALSAVVDGAVERSAGRTYHVRTAQGGDDYAAMAEVIGRRFARARKGDPGWSAPDLLVVDGGRGQLSVAIAVLKDLGLGGQPVVALAKERSSEQAVEVDRVYLPGRKNPIPLFAENSALQVLARARDEAHRLALAFQRKARRKRTRRSRLDGIAGVGAKTKVALLRHLGSLTRIRQASLAKIMEVPGVGKALAERIRQSLNEGRDASSPPSPAQPPDPPSSPDGASSEA